MEECYDTTAPEDKCRISRLQFPQTLIEHVTIGQKCDFAPPGGNTPKPTYDGGDAIARNFAHDAKGPRVARKQCRMCMV